MERDLFNKNILALGNSNSNLATKVNKFVNFNNYTYIKSKTGEVVPCTRDGSKALHSKLDPTREGKRFLSMYKNKGFLIFFGLGGGYHIKPFIEKNEFSNILILDNNMEQFKDVISNIDMKEIFLNPAVNILIDPTKDELYNYIVENYIPAICGDVTTIPLRQRVNSEFDFFNNCIDSIKDALNRISDDYTVQTRFGKKWFSNTLFNLKNAYKSKPILKPGKISYNNSSRSIS